MMDDGVWDGVGHHAGSQQLPKKITEDSLVLQVHTGQQELLIHVTGTNGRIDYHYDVEHIMKETRRKTRHILFYQPLIWNN